MSVHQVSHELIRETLRGGLLVAMDSERGLGSVQCRARAADAGPVVARVRWSGVAVVSAASTLRRATTCTNQKRCCSATLRVS